MRDLIDPPIPSVQEPVFSPEYLEFLHWTVRAIPSGVHPDVVKSYIFLRDLIDQAQAGGCFHSTPYSERNRQNHWLRVNLGSVIFQDMAPQSIMRVNVVSFPRQQEDFRRSNLLT